MISNQEKIIRRKFRRRRSWVQGALILGPFVFLWPALVFGEAQFSPQHLYLAREQVEDRMVLMDRIIQMDADTRLQVKNVFVAQLLNMSAEEGARRLEAILGRKRFLILQDWENDLRHVEVNMERRIFLLSRGLDLRRAQEQLLRLFLSFDPSWETKSHEEWYLQQRAETIIELLSLSEQRKPRVLELIKYPLDLNETAFLEYLLELTPEQIIKFRNLPSVYRFDQQRYLAEWDKDPNRSRECGGLVDAGGERRSERRRLPKILTKSQMGRFLDYRAGILPSDFGFESKAERQYFLDTYAAAQIQYRRRDRGGYEPRRFDDPETDESPSPGTSLTSITMSGNLLTEPTGEVLNPAVVAKEYFGGHVTLIYLWASWCESCIAELEVLNRMADIWRGSGIEIIAINTDSEVSNDKAKHIALSRRWKFRLLNDLGNHVIMQKFNPRGVPRVFFADTNGNALSFLDPATKRRVTRVIGNRPWESPQYFDALRNVVLGNHSKSS